MTAIILDFPDIWERNNLEFDRTGSTTYTRAVEEAHDLVVKIIRLVPNCPRPQTTDIGWITVICPTT